MDNKKLNSSLSNWKIEIYRRLTNEKDVDVITSQLEKEYDDYDKFVSVQKDSKFGSFVFCGTSDAINASGITIVDVKVK